MYFAPVLPGSSRIVKLVVARQKATHGTKVIANAAPSGSCLTILTAITASTDRKMPKYYVSCEQIVHLGWRGIEADTPAQAIEEVQTISPSEDGEILDHRDFKAVDWSGTVMLENADLFGVPLDRLRGLVDSKRDQDGWPDNEELLPLTHVEMLAIQGYDTDMNEEY